MPDVTSQPGSAPAAPLDVDALRAALQPPAGPVPRVEVFPQVGSTNDALCDAVRGSDVPELTVFTTDFQSAGHGRLGRVWTAPRGTCLPFSVLVRPARVPVETWGWLSMLLALSVADALRAGFGLDACLKWPNDVLLRLPDEPAGTRGAGVGYSGADAGGPREAKVAGVLAAITTDPAGEPAAVIGAGINVSLSRAELPVPHATSLRLAGVTGADRTALLTACVRSFAARHRRWLEAAGDARASGLAQQVAARCATLGRWVRAEMPSGDVWTGRAVGLDDRGELVVDVDGRRRTVSAADVRHLRAATAGPR